MLTDQEIDDKLDLIQIHEDGRHSYSVRKMEVYDRQKRRGHYATVPRQARNKKRNIKTLAKILGKKE